MAGSTSVALLRDIQTLFDAGTAAGLSDRQLLDRFASRRDAAAEAAFEVLVLRHGPMVLRVCRNVLHDPNDAQDAFQATFLVLVRRCGAVRQLESLGGWLYGVANRVATRARVEAARRRAVEGRAALRVVEAFEPSAPLEADPEDFGPIVQEEVRRLPEKYRAAVVLCYWQGLTHEQAAVQLSIPLGTVRSRVARARELLRRRLTRRGLAPLAGVVAAGLDGSSATAPLRSLAPVPAELVPATVRAAAQVAAGQATSQVVSGVVASLVQRVIWSMTMIKISGVAAGVVLVGLAGYGVGTAAQQTGQPQPARRVGQVADNERGQSGQRPQQEFLPSKKAAPELERHAMDVSFVHSAVDGEAIVVSIRPPGALVKKGDLVCELDSTRFQDQLLVQLIAVESAKADYQNARLTREVAEIAVVEYQEGIYLRDLQEVEGDLQVAIAELDLAQEEQKAAKTNPENKLAIKRAELDVFRAKVGIKKAEARRRVLVEFTKGRTIKELRSEVEKARGDELSKQAIWELQKRKQIKLERQITNCRIVAPIDGSVQNFLGGAGQRVQVGQVLISIIATAGAKPKDP